MAARVFVDRKVDFAGLQEVLSNQLHDLQERLPAYGWVGVGRDDGKQAGEYAPIFYRVDKFEVRSHGTFWLSEMPETPGKPGWDAACPRIATWGVFRDRGTGDEIFLINTHFDNAGTQARINGAKLMLERIAALRGNRPVIVTGDFNSGENDVPIRTLTTAKDCPLRLAQGLSRDPERGGRTTFNGFRNLQGVVIDFILVSPGIGVERYQYLTILRGGIPVSDHWPVLSWLSMPGKSG
jgi:endonuclease/exonuclease/phosphatase family metal-dependent hydrolase